MTNFSQSGPSSQIIAPDLESQLSQSYDELVRLVRHLKEGGPLIYPTETFFGLGCDAMNAAAVAVIYQAKQRSATKPLPLIAADVNMARKFCDLSGIPARLLTFWPGPLTVLAKASEPFPPALMDEEGRVAIRVSGHPVACALSRGLDRPITATSANLSNHDPASSAAGLDPDIVARVGLVADLPPAPAGGVPSTIVSMLANGCVCVHRQGAITCEALVNAGLTLA